MGGESKFPETQPPVAHALRRSGALGSGLLDEFNMPAMPVEEAIGPPVVNQPPAPTMSADAEPGARKAPKRRSLKPPAARAPSPEKQGEPRPPRTRLHALPTEPWPKEPTKTRVDDCIVDALWQLEGWLPGILKERKGFGADDITMMCFALYRSRDTFNAGEYSAPHSNALLAKLADKGRSYWTHDLIEKTYIEREARYRLTTDGRDYLNARDRRQLSPDELKSLFETAKHSILIYPLDRYYFTR